MESNHQVSTTSDSKSELQTSVNSKGEKIQKRIEENDEKIENNEKDDNDFSLKGDDSLGGGGGGGEDGKGNKRLYRLEDLFARKPRTLKEKWQTFAYNRGLASRPPYLEEIYRKTPRYVYVNQKLPDILSNSLTGRPLLDYPRNKIRTTKYTPLSFLPKNILFQFTNVANTYFLMVVILGAFQVFGVADPGLAAVPLIVIVAITAIKDAIEDYRRAKSDSDLNNSPIHLVQGLDNPNVEVDYIGPWRRFKKACTKINRIFLRGLKKVFIFIFFNKRKKHEYNRKLEQEKNNALHRVSTVISDHSLISPQQSLPQNKGRPSTQSHASRHKVTKPQPNSIINPNLFANGASSTVFKNRSWKDVCIGDFIRVRSDEEIPADIILISTSDVEGGCFIETKNLDGETNLKSKSCLQCGSSSTVKHAADVGNSKFWVECDPPNRNMYSFKGTVHYENYDADGNLVNDDEKEAVTYDNVLFRGCTLRNTKWVIGLVVYTGPETKIMLNSGITPTKRSRISKELNFSVIINFALLFVLCFVTGLINGLYYRKKHTSRVYFDFKPYGHTDAANGVIAFFVSIVNYQGLVPISLYITIEIIKTLQALFIYLDAKMFYPQLNYPCIPNAWNISDDLGQIEYIFSDKTGTLTQNIMSFRKCTIRGKSYGVAYTEARQGLDKRDGLDVVAEQQKWNRKITQEKQDMYENLVKYSNNDQLNEQEITFVSSDYTYDTIVPEVYSGEEQKEANEAFMFALALCHTVITEEDSENPHARKFKAESPDESALVMAARDVGIVFRSRVRKQIILDVYGDSREYEQLQNIPFSSTRKRMSCILRTPDNKIVLYSKGADNVIYSRLNPKLNDDEMIKRTAIHLEEYANEGLRTLCVAYKELDPSVYEDWQKRFHEANTSIGEDREEIIEKLEDEIEQGMILLGGTAIEDKLQDGVPDSISILSQAGIKLWVLTGDKVETAINIGFSCNLLENSMKLLVVRPSDEASGSVEEIDKLLTGYLQEHFGMLQNDTNDEVDALIKEAKKDHSSPSPKFALIIDGVALGVIFGDHLIEDRPDKHLKEKFLLLGKQCKSVICCRVSPSQKASVLNVVKESLQVMTLAIGDGANDVAMIQAAHVGVGIAGEEGRQAAMTSDYSFGQFRYLTRLLLVHGRWSYKRLAEMVPCFFYKNVVFTITLFWYGIYSSFDGAELYEYTYLMFYNLAFTSLPVIMMGVFDQDVSDTVSLVVPQLYRSGILGLEWSQYKFLWYMFDGLYQSVISFYFPYLLFYKSFQSVKGLPIDHRFWIGVVAVSISVISCDFYVLLQQYRWDWFSLLIYAISILLVFFWTGVWSAGIRAAEFYKAGAQVLGTLSCWCDMFIGIIICVLPRFTYDFLKKNFSPKDIDIIRERALNGDYDEYPEQYDPTDKEDIERLRLLRQVKNGDPDVLKRMEENIWNETHRPKDEDGNQGAESAGHHPLRKTIKSIKRRATLSRHESKHHRNTINKLDLHQLRLQMMREGEFGTGSRNSLERVTTTHELPGLTQAESLMSYHTRNSLNLNR